MWKQVLEDAKTNTALRLRLFKLGCLDLRIKLEKCDMFWIVVCVAAREQRDNAGWVSRWASGHRCAQGLGHSSGDLEKILVAALESGLEVGQGRRTVGERAIDRTFVIPPTAQFVYVAS